MRAPDGVSEHEIVVRRSRFIARAFSVASAEDAKITVAAQRRTHSGCDHVAYAYLLGEHGDLFGMSDDHEPKGTAGRPILDVLKGSDITNILVTVVRYFGGTKLGTGGLVHAYSDAAKGALAALPTKELEAQAVFSLTVGYDQYEITRRLVAEAGGRIQTASFAESVVIAGTLPVVAAGAFAARVRDLTAGASAVEIRRPE